MACHTNTLPPPAVAQLRTLPSGAAFYLLASITLSFLAGSSAPTPLYAIYRSEWGFSATMLCVVFGVYAFAVLASLIVAGRVSDHVGRRPVLLAATLVQIAAMLTFATAHGLGQLLFGRIIQGLSAGAALAAVGAGLLDLDKSRGTIANSVAPMLGTGLGGVVSGLMVQYLPAPAHLVYAVMGAVFVLQWIGLLFMAETTIPRPGALQSLKPQFSLPVAARGSMLYALPAVVAVWALAGFYASLGPTLLRTLAGSNAIVLGGLALFVLAGSGALAIIVLRQRDPRSLLQFGSGALLVGTSLVLGALALRSVPLFLAGTAVAGAGVGAGFQGALRGLVMRIGAHERAGVLSVLFVVAYLALGGPAILAGYSLAAQGDIMATAREFGGMVILLAAVAMLGTLHKDEDSPRFLAARPAHHA